MYSILHCGICKIIGNGWRSSGFMLVFFVCLRNFLAYFCVHITQLYFEKIKKGK